MIKLGENIESLKLDNFQSLSLKIRQNFLMRKDKFLQRS